tara:strand:+ start:3173 stop:4582 length:1410 start_codon:yes stop_codon:yes gene_type:complete
MKSVREKRREITKSIHKGTIKEIGSVSAKSKIIRNLNSSECDNILRYNEIQYSKYKHIIAQEGVEIFSEGVDGGQKDDGGANPSDEGEGSESESESKSESESESEEKPTEIPEDAMQKLAEENDIYNQDTNNTERQYMTNQGLYDIASVKEDIGIDGIKNAVGGQAKVIDGLIIKSESQRLVSQLLIDRIDKVAEESGSGSMEVKVSTIKKPKTIEGTHFHPKFKDIVEKLQLNADKCVYLCGGAGTGKTTLAEQVAKTMELPFGFLSCTEGMSEAHLLGRMLFNGDYVASEFVTLYENGGVFLLDEMDAMDSNVAVVINSALANGKVSVPNRKDNPIAERHENFFVIGAGNTWGTGQGSNMYSGRNKLDSATLDRFWGIEVDYDAKLEKMLAVDSKMYDAVLELRKRVAEYGLNRIVGTRRFKDAGRCHANGKSAKYLLEHITTGWTKEEINKVGVKDIVINTNLGGK